MTIITLLFVTVGDSLYIASTIEQFLIDQFGFPKIIFHPNEWISLEVAAGLFIEWPELLILSTVAVIFRDRYRSHSSLSSEMRPKRNLIISLTILSSLLAILLLIFPIIYVAFWAKLSTPRSIVTVREFSHLFSIYQNLHYAYVGIYTGATLLLISLTFLIRKSMVPDPIAKRLTLGVIPILTFRAIARVIFLILEVRLPLRENFTPTDGYALDFSSTLILDGLFLAAMSIIVACLMHPHWWKGPGEHIMLEDTPTTAGNKPDDLYLPQSFNQNIEGLSDLSDSKPYL